MDRLVMVPSQGDSRVFPSMPELLAPLAPHLRELRWSIYELDPWLSREPTDQGAFLDQLATTERGLELPFEALQQFADSTIQIVDGLFLGTRRPRPFPARGANDATLIEAVDVLLSAFDSSFWIIGGPEPLLHTVEREFTSQARRGPLRS